MYKVLSLRKNFIGSRIYKRVDNKKERFVLLVFCGRKFLSQMIDFGFFLIVFEVVFVMEGEL